VELLLLTVVAGVSCHVALHERDAKTLDGQGEAARRRVLEALGYRQIAAADPLGGEQAGDEQRGVLGSTPE
jgi:hypothetical protein